jgi:hypothetical protein
MSEQLIFVTRESANIEAGASADGLTWPIQVMQSGFGHGEVMTSDPRFAGLPHYFPKDVVAQVAEACKSARFGRHHPQSKEEEYDPARVAGWLDGGRMEGNAARATLHLFENEKDLQGKLVAARKAGRLDLFGTSILAAFAWNRGTAEGRDALVAQRLARLISVDMVTEAGAGGKFLMAYAASLSSRDVEFGGGKMKVQVQGGRVRKALRPWVQRGLDGEEKLQLGMDLMFGVKQAAGEGVSGFKSFEDSYKQVTGAPFGAHFTTGGGFWAKTKQSIAMSDFPNILLNSMTKRLIQDYGEFPLIRGIDKIYVKTDFRDFKPQDRVRMGYLTDLPQVTEPNVFTELTKPTDEKITYLVNKFGGMFTISEETIRSNDLGGVMLFINRMARAARHTVCQFISNFFITNPNYDPDGLPWFVAGHNNSGVTALTPAELDVRAVALLKQTEKDSGNRMALPLEWIMVPAELLPTAMLINRNVAVANNDWVGKFGDDDENIIVNPLLTDANDWYGGCFPASAPSLEIGFLDGIDVPQLMMLASKDQLPAGNTMFTNDEIRCKCSFVFGGKPVDFRGVFKEIVP